MGNCIRRGHSATYEHKFTEEGYICVRYNTNRNLPSRAKSITLNGTCIPDTIAANDLPGLSGETFSQDVNTSFRKSVNEKLLDLDKTVLSIKRSDEEVDNIKESVDTMVDHIASWFGDTNPLFKFSHKYLVGSMAEGTRIIEPNEFDYILVLHHLSKPNVLRVERFDVNIYLRYGRVKSHPVNHAHIKLINQDILNMYSTFAEGKRVRASSLKQHISVVCERLNYGKEKTKLQDVNSELGTLSFTKSLSMRGPACTFLLKWTPDDISSIPLDISIDLVPAIQVEIDNDIISKEDMNSELYSRMNLDGTYLLIPRPPNGLQDILFKYCFNFTFTLTEVSVMKSLSVNHIICYKVLKYLLQQSKRQYNRITFSSYTIKMLLLKHVSTCSEPLDIYSCIQDILARLSDCFKCVHQKIFTHMDERFIFMNCNYLSQELYDVGKPKLMVERLTFILDSLIEKIFVS